MEKIEKRRVRRESVPFKPRPRKEFIELLEHGTEFGIRHRRGRKEFEVRLGTSFHNSVALPPDKLEIFIEHAQNVLAKRDEKLAELQKRMEFSSDGED